MFLLLQNCMASPSPTPGKHFRCMPEIKHKTLMHCRIEYCFIWDNTGNRGQKGYLSQKVNISVCNPSTEKHRQTWFSVAYIRHSSNAPVRPWRDFLSSDSFGLLTKLKHNWTLDIPHDPWLPEPEELVLWQTHLTLRNSSSFKSFCAECWR